MAAISISNRRTNGVIIGIEDTLDLTVKGSVSVSGGFGVVGAGQNTLTLDGDILNQGFTAVSLGAGVNNIIVGTSALLLSGGGSGAGVTALGGQNNLVNAGQIVSLTGEGVRVGQGGNYVLNTGVIYGLNDALHIAAGGPGSIIENAGLIQSLTGAAITANQYGNSITNSGVIDGGDYGLDLLGGSVGEVNSIINFGTIIGRDIYGIFGANGADIITNLGVISGSVAAVRLFSGDDVFDNGGGTVVGAIDMGSGNDRVVSGVGAETINGGTGRDTISYIVASQAVIIDLGAQVTFDGFVNDTLSGFENAIGSNFNDTLFGGNGQDDVLDGGRAGADQINGGNGNDTASWATSLVGVVIDLTAQAASDGDTLSSIENAIGSAFADTIFGNGSANIIDGGSGGPDVMHGFGGTDTISYLTSTSGRIIDLAVQAANDGDTFSGFENAQGSLFNDQIFGDGGDNVFVFSGGADAYQGNGGTDTVSYAGRSTGIIVDLGAGASNSGDVFSSIENAIGSDGDDTFFGDGGGNVFTGGLGGDTLNGFGGSDALYGGDAADRLNGGEGNDLLDGGEGNDILDGGRGNDTMNGGSGVDRFIISNLAASGNPGDYSGNDTIIGFERIAGPQGDRVELQAVAFASWTAAEGSGSTTFSLTDAVFGLLATVRVFGVTGMAAGDDWLIF